MKADSKMLCASSMSMCVMFLSRMQTNRRKLVDVNVGGKKKPRHKIVLVFVRSLCLCSAMTFSKRR